MAAGASVSQPFADTAVPAGTVRVSVHVAAPADSVWRDLTDSSRVGRWFGDLSGDLLPGAAARLDFGDADFFAITGVEVSKPRELRYSWRFLGTGPADRVVWTIKPEASGSLVTVDDSEPMRSAETARELTEGWTDFLQRLERHIATGKVTRYDWRRSFEGAIEIPLATDVAAVRLFGVNREPAWLPFAGGRVENNSRLRLSAETQASATFAVSAVNRTNDSLTFDIRKNAWLSPTECSLQLSPRGKQAILSLHHTGWDSISENPGVCMEQRRLFGSEWVAALHRARDLTVDP